MRLKDGWMFVSTSRSRQKYQSTNRMKPVWNLWREHSQLISSSFSYPFVYSVAPFPTDVAPLPITHLGLVMIEPSTCQMARLEDMDKLGQGKVATFDESIFTLSVNFFGFVSSSASTICHQICTSKSTFVLGPLLLPTRHHSVWGPIDNRVRATCRRHQLFTRL